jgi:RWP-RK domain
MRGKEPYFLQGRRRNNLPLNTEVMPLDIEHGVLSSKSGKVSISDSPVSFQSSAGMGAPFSSTATHDIGHCDSWWLEPQGGGFVLSEFGADMVERCSTTSPHNDAGFDLAIEFPIMVEGAPSRSLSHWDCNGGRTVDISFGIPLEVGNVAAVPGNRSGDVQCDSEPQSETFHFEHMIDDLERDETQGLDGIFGLLPRNVDRREGDDGVATWNRENKLEPETESTYHDILAKTHVTVVSGCGLNLDSEKRDGNSNRKLSVMSPALAAALRDEDCCDIAIPDADYINTEGPVTKSTLSVESTDTGPGSSPSNETIDEGLLASYAEKKQPCGATRAETLHAGKTLSANRCRLKTTQKPPTTTGISLQHLKDVFHLHRPEAERQLNLKRTTFSNLSRHFGISKWPFRTLRDADKRLKHNAAILRKASTGREKRRKLETQQRRLRAVKELMYAEPHQSKDSNTLSVLLTMVADRERRDGHSST